MSMATLLSSFPVSPSGFAPNYTSIINTPNGIFLYRASDRRLPLAGLALPEGYPAGTFFTGWSHIVSLPTGVVWYRAFDGLMAFGRFTSTGRFNLFNTLSLSPEWSLITRAR
jgi:hypothetical protein